MSSTHSELKGLTWRQRAAQLLAALLVSLVYSVNMACILGTVLVGDLWDCVFMPHMT